MRTSKVTRVNLINCKVLHITQIRLCVIICTKQALSWIIFNQESNKETNILGISLVLDEE